ncbi:MAG: saccharopine dehydrogenase NADP-binding domain-containing protein [Gammaproteobacteria bacterium]|nr:saccharopine dehydrogenase NADP-binding domain-containing protein [Gammaproteobacteria bacterium]
MKNVLILGAGKIGTLVATMLSSCANYRVTIADLHPETQAIQRLTQRFLLTALPLDARNEEGMAKALTTFPVDTVISCLPYHCSASVARMAKRYHLHYFDLTEDVEAAKVIQALSADADTIFMPQCGLAPGFISIAANALIQNFESIDTVKMRVGALPQNPSNALKYSLTWSTDGLINEYGNACYGIESGEMTTLQPLEGYETIVLDGVLYEAFNTSGGCGTLAKTHQGRVKTMNYKTIRYPGHCEKAQFLMNDLKLNHNRDTLKVILENAIPQTLQDVVLIFVSVTGQKGGKLMEETFARKIYPHSIEDMTWSAIQVTTAAGVCGVLDHLAHCKNIPKGFVKQEDIALSDFLANPFGQYYAAP